MLRATLKSLLSRKLRLVLSGLAVVLGVMFVSGSLVLTDTLNRSFTDLFASVYADVDVQVAVKPKVDGAEGDDPVAGTLTADDLRAVEQVDGVRGAVGDVTGSARPIGENGKVLTTTGAPRLGTAWRDGGQEELRAGRPPRAEGEIAVSALLARTGGYEVGDRVSVLTLEPKREFTVTGVFGYAGGRDSLGGELTTAFTEAEAQRLLLGEPGHYSSVTVRAADGVAQDVLRQRVQDRLGDAYQVKTGEQLAADSADDINEGLAFFNYVLLGFAGIALFVGVFIILNTFSIIIAQRTRELALLRAMGAGRGQVVGSVVVEAVVIGLVASAVGLGAGIGVGALLAWLFSTFGGANLDLADLAVPTSAIVSSFAVGTVVTVLAALLPAVRASRIPPVAALREAATPDRPLTGISVAGAAVTAGGAVALGLGFNGDVLWLTMAGLLVSFVGVALLTPLVSKPVVSAIGKLMAWSTPGTLGRRNSARNPRRTAITAAALMVGIALITGVSVVLGSATASIEEVARNQVKADLIVSGDTTTESPATFGADRVDQLLATPGVATGFAWYTDVVMVDGERRGAAVSTDLAATRDLLGLSARDGSFTELREGEMALDEDLAARLGLRYGDTARVQTAKGREREYTVALVIEKNQVVGGTVLLPRAVADEFTLARPVSAYAAVEPGANPADVRAAAEPLFADEPEVSVQDVSAFVRQQTAQLDTVLLMIQVLLALAILIAVLGVVNTLALSVIERTRELGVLRAIGMRRAQVMRMITVESVVISVFGALLGLVVGTAIGLAAVKALADEGFTAVAVPWAQLGTYLLAAAGVGVVAAVLPAIRAARLNVLGAIAHD
ncbi:ABC transporter permease [Saccharothrix syringae]|uniref:ABC transporter permease n=1 Tax=Saccharothrix syringae TaxID=103733 RepID=A0A5Q0GZN7_SACSY|nr:FtsX-like permease family protein [Saccharothrix syringae]QFZ19313.1 ABC transporter permease [Saccharothrix syringae]